MNVHACVCSQILSPPFHLKGVTFVYTYLPINSGYVWSVQPMEGTDRGLVGREESGSFYLDLSFSVLSSREIHYFGSSVVLL